MTASNVIELRCRLCFGALPLTGGQHACIVDGATPAQRAHREFAADQVARRTPGSVPNQATRGSTPRRDTPRPLRSLALLLVAFVAAVALICLLHS